MKSLFILFFLLLAFSVSAQKGTTTFSVSYGDGKGQIKPIMAKAEMLGTYTEGGIRTLELSIVGALSKSTSLELGFSVLNHQYQFTDFNFPNKTATVNRSENSLVFPIKLRVDIFKYFFISGGILLSDEIGKEGPLDLGFGIGAGLQYYLKNKYGFFIYPQTNIHTPTIGLSERHIAFGLAYKIN